MAHGALSDDHLIQFKVFTGTLNAQKYQDEILESGFTFSHVSYYFKIVKNTDNSTRHHLIRRKATLNETVHMISLAIARPSATHTR